LKSQATSEYKIASLAVANKSFRNITLTDCSPSSTLLLV